MEERVIGETSDGVKINGVNINCIRYADDTLLITDFDVGFENLIEKVNELSMFRVRDEDKHQETQNDVISKE